MSASQDRRDARRVILAPPSEAHFVLKGHTFHEVRVTNISVSGCFLMVGKRDEPLFQKDALLEQMVLSHHDLPADAVTGQVVYTLGAGGPGLDFVGVGVHFVGIGDGTREQLQEFVVHKLGPMPEV